MMIMMRGLLAFAGYLINTLFWAPLVILFGLVKLLPIRPLQRGCSHIIDGIATRWIAINNCNQRWLSKTQLRVSELPELSPKQWYLMLANHQSWVDILVLQRIFNQRIPMIKFFLKQELLYVPIIGLAWWALDFPFMKRYSKATLTKKPQLQGKDQLATQQACQKFQLKPVTIMNFVEGTRFTSLKQQQQHSPYPNLLIPKAGGIALAINAMSGKLQQLLDVTICYPNGIPSFWQYLSGQVPQIAVHIGLTPLAEIAQLNYQDPQQRMAMQAWLNRLWQQKANTLEQLHQRDSSASPLPLTTQVKPS